MSDPLIARRDDGHTPVDATGAYPRAAIVAAIAAYLQAEEQPSETRASAWALAARPRDESATQPWAAGAITWVDAERPR